MRVVEFIGPSGVGKTTLLAHFVEDIEHMYDFTYAYKSSVCEAIFRRNFSFAVERIPRSVPSNLARIIGLTDRSTNIYNMKYKTLTKPISRHIEAYSRDERRIDSTRRRLLTLAEEYSTVEQYWTKDGFVALDEGFTHRATSVFCPPVPDAPLSENDVYEYANSIPIPDRLIFLDADSEVCESRMRQRESGYPHDQLTREEWIDRLDRMRRCLKLVTERLSDRGSEIIELNATKPTETLVSRIGHLSETD